MSTDTNLTAELARMRKRLGSDDVFMSCPCGRGDHKACRNCPYRHCSVHGIEARLLASVDAVLALHLEKVKYLDEPQPFRYCSRCSGHPAWPCPEVQAISRALLGEDRTDER